MKGYRQVYLIVKDRGFVYQPVADIPEFHKESDALRHWEYNKESILDANFYNDPIVIIRKEVNNVKTKDLYER
jgi:hypothetical protein